MSEEKAKKSSRKNFEFCTALIITRYNRGMTQAELAKAAGLQAATISHFERGQRQPSLANLRKLCIALKVSADYLLFLPNQPTP